MSDGEKVLNLLWFIDLNGVRRKVGHSMFKEISNAAFFQTDTIEEEEEAERETKKIHKKYIERRKSIRTGISSPFYSASSVSVSFSSAVSLSFAFSNASVSSILVFFCFFFFHFLCFFLCLLFSCFFFSSTSSGNQLVRWPY